MTLTLSQLYIGPLEVLTPPSVGQTPATDVMPGRDLLVPARLSSLLERFGTQYGHGDRRGVASQWSKWHFNSVVAPALAANLLLERELPLALDEIGVTLTADGHTGNLWLPHEGSPLAGLDPFVRFEAMLDRHLTPLIGTLAGISGASPRVFWSNLGNVFEYFANAATAHPMALPGASDDARHLLDSRCYPDGRRNPLYRPVRYVEDGESETKRIRRLCCVRYLLPELDYCSNCPLSCHPPSRSRPRAA